MASLAQLQSEPWWNREVVPSPLDRLLRDACAHFDTNPAGGGTRGNEDHLYGRHRSLEWCLHSRYCTDADYGTRDARDTSGDHHNIRAVDIPLERSDMIAVSHRLDTAVRAGRAPMVAEWFGTFDGLEVVGWYEGSSSSSDDSHLTHTHIGLWTRYANDSVALAALFAILIGAEDMTPVQDQRLEAATAITNALAQMKPTVTTTWAQNPKGVQQLPLVKAIIDMQVTLATLTAAVAALSPAPVPGPTDVTVTGTLTLAPPPA